VAPKAEPSRLAAVRFGRESHHERPKANQVVCGSLPKERADRTRCIMATAKVGFATAQPGVVRALPIIGRKKNGAGGTAKEAHRQRWLGETKFGQARPFLAEAAPAQDVGEFFQGVFRRTLFGAFLAFAFRCHRPRPRITAFVRLVSKVSGVWAPTGPPVIRVRAGRGCFVTAGPSSKVGLV